MDLWFYDSVHLLVPGIKRLGNTQSKEYVIVFHSFKDSIDDLLKSSFSSSLIDWTFACKMDSEQSVNNFLQTGSMNFISWARHKGQQHLRWKNYSQRFTKWKENTLISWTWTFSFFSPRQEQTLSTIESINNLSWAESALFLFSSRSALVVKSLQFPSKKPWEINFYSKKRLFKFLEKQLEYMNVIDWSFDELSVFGFNTFFENSEILIGITVFIVL